MSDRYDDDFDDDDSLFDDSFDDDFDDGETENDDDDLQAKIEAFDEKVIEQMRILLNPKMAGSKRYAAARWLGESGAPRAISALRKVYRNETKDKKLHGAVEYALGQFKALDKNIKRDRDETVGEALGRQENAHIVELLTDITVKGKFGRRTLIPMRGFMALQGFLLVTFIAFMGAGFILSGTTSSNDGLSISEIPTRAPGLSASEEAALDAMATMRTRLISIHSDGRVLGAQFGVLAGGGELSCELTFTSGEGVTLTPEVEASYPNISILANRVNAAMDDLRDAQDLHAEACATDTMPDAENLEAMSARLDSMMAALTDIESAIATTENSINVAPQVEEPDIDDDEDDTEPVEPTPEPTATIAPESINVHVREMLSIINTVTQQRGANQLLAQYWADVQQAGTTGGCGVTPPTIPDNYPELPADVAQAVPALNEAREQLNLGLTLLRDQGWPLFTSACASNTLPDQAATGAIVAQTAQNAFSGASDLLLNLRR